MFPLKKTVSEADQPATTSKRIAIGPRRAGTSTLVPTAMPLLLTVDEVADVLRTTRLAVYAMVARDSIPGVTRLGRRVLFRSDDLLRWLDQNRAPSPKE